MEALAFREICEEPEIDLFLERFQDYVGVRLPEDYVRKSRIIGVFLGNRLVGGYMLVLSPSFRSLLFVPDRTKDKNIFFANSPYEMMEVNGLWISSTLRNPKMQMTVWFHLVSNIFMAKKKYVLLLRDSRNKTMERLLGLAKPKVLYEGAPNLMAGDETHNQIQVSYASRWSILLNSYKYWIELRRRQRRARLFVTSSTKLVGLNGAKHTHPYQAN